jgi:glycosyltransferase involved in cell wall biosynthesis
MTPSARPAGEKVIVVLPAYHAERTLAAVLARIPRDHVDELVLVDDCSRDRTAEVARELGLVVFRNERNLGYGGNLKVCLDIALARGATIVVEVHPDDQYDPSAIPDALASARAGHALVLGSRFTAPGLALQHGMPRWKYLANIGLSVIARLVLRAALTEFHTGFRAYQRRLLERIDYHANADDYLFSFEVIAQARFAGLPIGEVPVTCRYYEGVTQISFGNSVRYAIGMLRVLARYVLACAGRPGPSFRLRRSDV